ncbi:MAG: gluconate 2-dehydrogenase gamma chain [Lysobacterales bacterium]|jgi:gluconate 2-dehydrogenase gamma chain
MPEEKNTRRKFIRQSGELAGAAWLGLSFTSLISLSESAQGARFSGDEFETLTKEEAIEIEAIAAQIMPTTDTPGATEAGVVYFIDKVLGGDRNYQLAEVRTGLQVFETEIANRYDNRRFSELSSKQQIKRLESIDDGRFFNLLWFLTMAGMFTNPSLGGNRNRVGWQLIGFEDRHFWQPPFGHYDEHYESSELQSEPKGGK